jgi:natural product precursor
MKKINKLSLTQLTKAELEKRQMNAIKGGCACPGSCGCLYAGPQCPSGDSYYGGSSTEDNYGANSYHNSEYVM